MSRTTTSKVILAAIVCAAMAWPGCSKKYPQTELAKDGPIARQVLAMAAALRAAGPEGLDKVFQEQAAGGLTPQQERSLRVAMLQIAKADEVELEDLSQFGRDVYRASLRLRAGGTSSEVCMLLVTSGGQLRWAGQN